MVVRTDGICAGPPIDDNAPAGGTPAEAKEQQRCQRFEPNGTATRRHEQEVDAAHAAATYIVGSDTEVLMLAPHVEAYSRNDPLLRYSLPTGRDAHIVLVGVEPLPKDIARDIGTIERVQVPPERSVAGILGWRGRPAAGDEITAQRDRWLEFMRNAVRDDVRENANAKQRRTRRRTIAELQAMPPLRWLIKDIMPVGSSVFFASGPNVGKTTYVLGAALSIYHGVPHLGHRTLPGSVIYFAGEGVGGLGRRIAAWQQEHDADDPGDRYFEVVDSVPGLSSRDGQEALYAVIREAEAEHGHLPKIVVLDTLSALWGDASEDDSAVAAPFMRAVNAMCVELGVTFVLLHHVAKAKDRNGVARTTVTLADLRGSSAFAGAADVALGLEPTDIGARLVTLKAKETEKAAPENLVLHKVPLGINEDGDALSAAFFVPAAPEPADQKVYEHQARIAAAERMVVEVCETLQALGGSTTSKDSIYIRMTGKTDRKRAAVADAIDRDFIRPEGTERHRNYVLTDAGKRVCSTPPDPLGRGGAEGPSPTKPPRDEGRNGADRGGRAEDQE